MIRKNVRLLFALMSLIAASFIAAVPASAAPSVAETVAVSTVDAVPAEANETVSDAYSAAVALVTYGCVSPNNTRICVYTGDDLWEGSEYYWTAANYLYECVNIGGSFNNNVRSAIAFTNYYEARFYTGANCTGSTVVNLSNPGAFQNCKNSYGANYPWNTGVSPCSGPNISSFYVS